MTRQHPGGRTAPSRSSALVRALAGGLVMAAALGIGTAAGSAAAERAGLTGTAARLVPAAMVSALALVPVTLAVRRHGATLKALGLGGAGAGLRAFLLGLGVTAASAVLVLGAGTAGGLLRWSRPDLLPLVGFLITNAVVALLLEALPEETTLRGYAWTALRERFGGTASALGTTAVFLLVPGASTVAYAATARLVGAEPAPVGIVPPGQDAASYLILLPIFGLTLVAARTAVGRAPLWAAIGTHLTFLTVNRVALEGDRRDAGWSATQTSPDAVLLVPAYLLVAAAVFLLCRRVRVTDLSAELVKAAPHTLREDPALPAVSLPRRP
ncbi:MULTISPECIES: type II CAAX prenyl endopeptidase Rce1 family protein [unclassified Streptomyces]|uniref:CPBP family glutamic-type intramembrane protease n=1 Tax=unclassified Streptomyces TaxID=2593676 RepID=UPI0033E7D123